MPNIDLSKTPYFDDYDEEKRFLRILFRPGYAVQTRELNQLQTILQKQIDRFGQNIFENGSRVIDGGVKLDDVYDYVRLNASLNSSVADTYIGSVMRTTDGSNVTAKIVNVLLGENTIYVKYEEKDNETERGNIFASGDSLEIVLDGAANESVGVSEVGTGTAAHLSRGVYYIDGFFHLVAEQSLILSKYGNLEDQGEVSVGLLLEESITTEEDDSSLYDNANGTRNFNAPGAHRYQVFPRLINGTDSNLNDNDLYIEILNIQNGQVAYQARETELSVIEQIFARRTYDESGDYIVTPFSLNLKQHLKNQKYPDGVFEPTNGGDETQFLARLGSGKAYVRGFEIETTIKADLKIPKARSTETRNDILVPMQLGNYLVVDNVYQKPANYAGRVSLRTGTVSNDGTAAGREIGTALVRHFDFNDNTLNTSRVYLFDVKMNAGERIGDVKSLHQPTTSFTANVVVSDNEFLTTIQRANEKTPIYSLPYGVVKNVYGGLYNYHRTFNGNQISETGTVSLIVSAGNQFRDEVSDYIVTTVNGVNARPRSVTVDGASGNTEVTLSLQNLIDNNTVAAGDSVSVVARIQKDNATVRNKTPSQKQLTVSYDANNPDKLRSIRLDRPDVYEIVSIRDAQTNDTNYTSQYTLDTGQRDSFYDLASVSTNSAPPTENIVITYNYYAHSAGDYFVAQSYTDNDVDYEDIPVYTASGNGKQYPLANMIDMRPTINNNGTGFTSAVTFDPDSEILADFEYYVPRNDIIVLDKNGVFSVVNGKPSREPSFPDGKDSSIILYQLQIPAYTFRMKDIEVDKLNHRRYTMQDIGDMDQRLQNLEYYTLLSLLETDTMNQEFSDKFKSGFVVDNFETQDRMENTNPNNRMAIDLQNANARPVSSTKAIDFEIDETSSNNYTRNGDIVTLPYSNKRFITQPYASRVERLNPFLTAGWYGNMSITPTTDTWVSTARRPDVTLDGGTLESVEYQENKDSLGTVWDNWETFWTGSKSTTTKNKRTTNDVYWSANGLYQSIDNVSNTSYTEREKRTGITTSAVEKTKVEYIGDKVVSVSAVPYMREKDIDFTANGLKPRTRVYAFFDGVDVTDYCVPAGLVTDGIGSVSGTFQLPNDAALRFETGNKVFLLTDSQVGGIGTTYCKALYTATGTLKEYQKQFVSTRVLDIEKDTETQTRTKTIDGTTSNRTVNQIARRVTRRGSADDANNNYTIEFDVPYIEDENGNSLSYFSFVFETNGTDKYRDNVPFFSFNDGIDSSGFRVFDPSGTKVFDYFIDEIYRYNRDRIPASKTGTWRIEVYQENGRGDGWNKWTLSYPEKINNLVSDRCYTDPLAQSFVIDEKGGAFVTALDVFFGPEVNDVVNTGSTVRCQLRNMINGYPGTDVVPHGDVSLSTGSIQGSTDASVSTRFTFDAPVYLEEGNEYCFVLLTPSENITAWIAFMGEESMPDQYIPGTGRQQITKQPYLGSMFRSQNNRTWQADANSDIKFYMHRASFDINNDSMVSFTNTIADKHVETENDPYYALLNPEPFVASEGSSILKVLHQNHSFMGGDSVTFGALGNMYVTDVRGIPADSVFDRQLTVLSENTDTGEKMSPDWYFIDVGTNAATSSGRNGGGNVTATQFVQYSHGYFLIDTTQLNESNIDWTFSGMQRSTGTMSNATPFLPKTNIDFSPSVFFSRRNNDSSVNLRGAMSSDRENISPVIDLQRLTMLATENKINDVSDENNVPAGYDGYSRYILKQINLVNPANQLRVYIDANRPTGCSIDVYYKVQPAGEDGNFANDYDWVLMNEMSNNPVNENRGTFNEYIYDKGMETDFQTYSVKIVLRSNNIARVPVLNNFRAIALKGV